VTQRKAKREGNELASVLRAAGLRKTTPRVAVLDRLVAASAPLSHGEIADALAPLGYERPTVYRNLMDLVAANLVRRTDLGDHVWRFELRKRGGDHEHPHFLCVDCGEVSCLPDESVRIQASRGAPRAMRSRDVEVQVKGRCDACAG
jgi:Fur family ferric uptake transcriptional regulator